MTVETTHMMIHYQGNGVATRFPITFAYFEPEHIHVARYTVGGDWVWLVLNSDYTVDDPQRVNARAVTLMTPLQQDQTIAIIRLLQPLQLTDLRNQGQFYAETHEDALDYLTALIQQLDYWVGSSPGSQVRVMRLKDCDPADETGRWDAKGRRIVDLQDPMENQDAATKHYVDMQDDKLKAYIDNKVIGGGSGGGDFSGDCPCEAPAPGTIYTIYTSQMTTPDGETEAVKGFETLSAAFKTLAGKPIPIDKPVTLQIPKGIFRETETVIHSSAQEGLNIQGETTPVTITGVQNVESFTYTVTVRDNWVVGTEIPYHKVTFQLEDASGVSKGEFLLIRPNSTDIVYTWPTYTTPKVERDKGEFPETIQGNNAFEVYRAKEINEAIEAYRTQWETYKTQELPKLQAVGAHEIIDVNKDANQVTVLFLNRQADQLKSLFPGNLMVCTVVQSIIRYDPYDTTGTDHTLPTQEGNTWEGGVSAFRLESGGYLGKIDGLALVGRGRPYYTTADGNETMVRPEASTDDNRGPYEYRELPNFWGILTRTDTRIEMGSNSVISGFGANCMLVSGRCIHSGFLSNSWGQNIGIGSGGVVNLNNFVSCGSWLDGVCVQDGGILNASRIYLIGNARGGIIYSQGCATGANGFVHALYNGTRTPKAIGYTAGGNAAGLSVVGSAIVLSSIVAHNKFHGINASSAAQASFRNAQVFGNYHYGIRILDNAKVVFQNSSFYGNGYDPAPATEDGKGQANTTQYYEDAYVRNGAFVALTPSFGRESPTLATFSPIPNTFGRTGGFIGAHVPIDGSDGNIHTFGTAELEDEGGNEFEAEIVTEPIMTSTIMSLSSGTSKVNSRDLTIWHNGRVLVGRMAEPNLDYTAVDVEMECNGAIASLGCVPINDNACHLGVASKRWADIYCVNATINTSDWRIKDQIEVSPLGLGFINRLTPVKFKWLDYTEIKRKYRSRIIQGEDGLWYEKRQYIGDEPVEHTFIRPHYGLIAQQVKAAIEAEGQSDCAAYIKAEDTGTESLRYSELIAPLIRAIQELSARVEALETAANIQPAAYQAPTIPEYTLTKRTVIEHPIEETITQIDYAPEPEAPTLYTEDLYDGQ